jgi:hypothetical protein
MKSLREQFKEARGGKSAAWYLDFTLILITGLALFYGAIFWMSGDSVRAPFDLKVAIGCFLVSGVCVLLASNKVLVLGCAVMVPATLAAFNAGFTGNRRVLVFCLLSLAAGFLILILGTLARSFWRSSRRNG